MLCPRGQLSQREGKQALARLRSLLAELYAHPATARRHAAEVAILLDRIEGGLGRAASSRTSQRRGEGVVYRVEIVRGRESLTEERVNQSSNPARCPKSVYDALVQMLTAAPQGLSFDEICSQLDARDVIFTDFQARIPLRFWMAKAPPLIERARGKYRAARPRDFLRMAQQTWTAAVPT